MISLSHQFESHPFIHPAILHAAAVLKWPSMLLSVLTALHEVAGGDPA